MGPVGAVAEMLAKRERRDTRKRVSGWDLLWMLPLCAAFLLGIFAIGEAGSRWLTALIWAGYGLLMAVLVLVAERVVLRIRRRPAARAAWGPGRPLRLVAFLTIFGAVRWLMPRGSIEEYGLLWVMATAVLAGVVMTLIDKIVARRAPAP